MARTRTSKARAAAALGLLAALALAAGGCGNAELRERYTAERMAWKAGKLAQAMRSNPELATDEMRAEVERSYQAIVDAFPPAGEPATQEGRDIASIAGQSRLALAAMAVQRGDAERAREIYTALRDGYAFDRRLAVEARLGAGSAFESEGRWADAVAEYDALVAAWPPAADPAGAPDQRILRTPLKVAAGYAVRGDAATAERRFDAARAYYDRWEAEWEGSPTAQLALELKGESFAQQGRFAEAVATLELFDARYGSDANRASLWLRLAEIYATGLGMNSKAAEYYTKVEIGYPNDTSGATASVALAVLDIDAGRHAQGRARLERTLSQFKDQRTVSATAMHYLAVSYEREGNWETAATRYNALAQEHPSTLYGMEAPLRVARHYRAAGEEEAAEAAFERAVQQYERICSEAESTPAELAARSYLVEARLDQRRWADAAKTLVETAERFADSDAAPGMLLQAADLYTTKLGDAAKAAEVLGKVLDDYPEAPAAREAESRLAALGGAGGGTGRGANTE